MRALIVYESMYGNTHLIANAIAEGLRTHAETVVVPVGEADASLVERSDLVVVGGPTHAHGMSRDSTRQGAVAAAEKPGAELTLDPDAAGSGLREWLASVGRFATPAAAFDARVDLPVRAHRARIEGHRPQAAPSRRNVDRRTGELPRDEGHPPRAERGSPGTRLGRPPRFEHGQDRAAPITGLIGRGAHPNYGTITNGRSRWCDSW